MADGGPSAGPAPKIYPAPVRTRPRFVVAGNLGANAQLLVVNGRRPGLSDAYHYLVRAPWPITIGVMAGTFLVANLLFATLYYAVGGLAEVRPDSFLDHFFFSVETMGTIGYGVFTRRPPRPTSSPWWRRWWGCSGWRWSPAWCSPSSPARGRG